MKYPTNGMEIYVFVDTNVLGEYETLSQKQYLKCDRFPESAAFSQLVRFAKTFDLKNFQICLPEIVIREIIHQMVVSYESTRQSYCEILAHYKKVLGETLKEKHQFIFEKRDDNVRFALSECKRFLKRYSEYVRVIKHPNKHFSNLMEKALSKKAPFAPAKSGGKDYSDAGFKDAVLWECILQEAKKDKTFIILFSNDRGFSAALSDETKNNIVICYTFGQVVEKIKELYDFSEINKITQEFKTNEYMWERVLEMVQQKGAFDISTVNFLSIEPDNIDDTEDEDQSDTDDISQTYFIKVHAKIDSKLYLFEIRYDFSSNEVMNAEIEQERE